jgi:ribosomal protein L9
MKATLHKKYKNRSNSRTKKNYKNTKNTKNKKWETAIQAARETLKQTGSLEKAKIALNKQALINARKLFGSVVHA